MVYHDVTTARSRVLRSLRVSSLPPSPTPVVEVGPFSGGSGPGGVGSVRGVLNHSGVRGRDDSNRKDLLLRHSRNGSSRPTVPWGSKEETVRGLLPQDKGSRPRPLRPPRLSLRVKVTPLLRKVSRDGNLSQTTRRRTLGRDDTRSVPKTYSFSHEWGGGVSVTTPDGPPPFGSGKVETETPGTVRLWERSVSPVSCPDPDPTRSV